jgi:hypothetical protein
VANQTTSNTMGTERGGMERMPSRPATPPPNVNPLG